MQVVKFEHACFAVEIDEHFLIVDPGSFTAELPALQVDVIVLTHIHADHVSEEHLQALLAHNPNVQIFSTSDVAKALPQYNIAAVQPGDTRTVGKFSLVFGGGKHAIIHPDLAPVQNLSILINDTIYYPGDAFTPAPKLVQVLLAPASAPWLKISEAIDFIRGTEAVYVIPTHDAILSEKGKQIHDNMLRKASEDTDKKYLRLQPGDAITVQV